MEDRVKVARNAKLVAAVGGMTTKTRVGRENATAGNAELKMRLGADERTQVRPLLPISRPGCDRGHSHCLLTLVCQQASGCGLYNLHQ